MPFTLEVHVVDTLCIAFVKWKLYALGAWKRARLMRFSQSAVTPHGGRFLHCAVRIDALEAWKHACMFFYLL